MKTLYIDCGMGAAGDMLTAALLELTENPAETVKELNELGIPGVEYVLEPSVKCGITGSHMHVLVNGEEEGEHMHDHHHHDHDHEHEHHHDHDHEHEHHHDHDHEHEHHHDHDHEHEHHHHHDHEHGIAHEAHDHEHTHSHEHGHSHSHSSMHGIEHIVMGHLHISDSVKKNVMSVYGLIAAAESQVHGMPVDQVHFHEVGSMDAVADVTAVCYLMEKLGVEQVIASPIHVGSGTVKCAHGILPVPAPATALILEGMPIYSRSEIRGELCTPTGAALLKNFVNTYGDMPVMRVEKIGYGMGKKDFPIANCVRVMLGETEGKKQEIYELNCNVDDMTGEEMSYAMKKIFEAGAVEVFTTAVGMKKSRPGTKITVITLPEHRDAVISAMFAHTTTLGVREMVCGRHVMNRKIETVETPYGEVRRKVSSGYGVTRSKYEYDDLSALADANHLSIRDILDEIKK